MARYVFFIFATHSLCVFSFVLFFASFPRTHTHILTRRYGNVRTRPNELLFMFVCSHRYFREIEDAPNILVEKELVLSQERRAFVQPFLFFNFV